MVSTYRIAHRTSYRYGASMTDGYTVTCLVPRPTEWQTVVDAEVRLVPEASEWDSYLDAFGNLVNQFGLHVPHDEMTVEAISVVEVADRPVPEDPTPWEDVAAAAAQLDGPTAVEVGIYGAPSTFVDVAAFDSELRPIAAGAFEPGRSIVDAASALCTSIHQGFDYDPSFSEVSTPLDEVLRERRGVCQDFAHLAIGCLRSLGLPARYVSGYLETVPPPGEPKLVGADASHAWCSLWTPGAGWVDFDPTNGHLPVNDHVTVAWGRDYADVTPVRGVMIGPATTQELEVSVDVTRIGV